MDSLHIPGAQHTPTTVGGSTLHDIAESTVSVSTNEFPLFPSSATGSIFTCNHGACECGVQIVFRTLTCDNSFDN